MATWREKKKKERSNRKRQMQEVGWVFLRVRLNEKHQYGNWKKRDKEMMCNWLGRSPQLIALTQL